jgi:hypothetical protein
MLKALILALRAKLCKLFFAAKRASQDEMMSNVVSGTNPQVPGRHESLRALLRAGKNDEAIVQLSAICITRPDDIEAKELLFDAFYQKRDWAPA